MIVSHVFLGHLPSVETRVDNSTTINLTSLVDSLEVGNKVGDELKETVETVVMVVTVALDQIG